MMISAGDEAVWEAMWAPYDEATYAAALDYVPPGAAVLDIGAGDLRLARRLAERARLVYAIERRPELLRVNPLPANLIVMCGDARTMPFPPVETAVLLMRHCRRFGLYRAKLAAVDCARLITNARWRLGVECIDLAVTPLPYDSLAIGWYACLCGATGFRPGPVGQLTARVANTVYEVDHCPECKDHGRISDRLS
jgi:hypothetical protein